MGYSDYLSFFIINLLNKLMKKLLLFLMVVFVMVPLISFATSGCCSWHGGVCGCDTSTGSQLCCDGSDSPSCGCQYIPPKPTPIKTTTPKKDTTDYKALSDSLQSQLAAMKSDLDYSNNLSSNKDKEIQQYKLEITDLQKSIDNRNGWLWFLGITFFIGICIHFGKEDKHW